MEPTSSPDQNRQSRGLSRFWPGSHGSAAPGQRMSDEDESDDTVIENPPGSMPSHSGSAQAGAAAQLAGNAAKPDPGEPQMVALGSRRGEFEAGRQWNGNQGGFPPVDADRAQQNGEAPRHGGGPVPNGTTGGPAPMPQPGRPAFATPPAPFAPPGGGTGGTPGTPFTPQGGAPFAPQGGNAQFPPPSGAGNGSAPFTPASPFTPQSPQPQPQQNQPSPRPPASPQPLPNTQAPSNGHQPAPPATAPHKSLAPEPPAGAAHKSLVPEPPATSQHTVTNAQHASASGSPATTSTPQAANATASHTTMNGTPAAGTHAAAPTSPAAAQPDIPERSDSDPSSPVSDEAPRAIPLGAAASDQPGRRRAAAPADEDEIPEIEIATQNGAARPATGWATVPTSGIPSLAKQPNVTAGPAPTAPAPAPAPAPAAAAQRRSASLEDADSLPRAGRPADATPTSGGPLRPGDVTMGQISFWDEEAITHFRKQWHEVKADFVDDPVNALTRAHDLLTEAVNELTESLLAERDELDPLDGRATPDTESMRMAMRGYREFLDRILAL